MFEDPNDPPATDAVPPRGETVGSASASPDELELCSASELSELVLAQAAAVEAAQVLLIQTIAVWDARQAWGLDHALSPAPWLTRGTACSPGDAHRLVGCARLCRAVPAVAAALAAGELSTTQLALLAGVAGQGRDRLFAEHVATLLGLATDLNIHDFTRVVRRWRNLADDELGRTDPQVRDAQEHLRLDPTMDEKWRVSGLVDGELAAMVKACLDRYDQPDPADSELPRTRPQRDVDNLRSILRDLMGGKTGQANITVTAVIDLDLLTPPAGETDPFMSGLPRLDARCRINGLGDVERHTIERMMCGSRLNRVILRGGSCVLDYGRRVRLFSRAQHQAIMIRDGFHCAVAGCRRTDLEVHHLHDYDHGGPTDLSNGACLCPRHHTILHRDKLIARWNDHGELILTAPHAPPLRS